MGKARGLKKPILPALKKSAPSCSDSSSSPSRAEASVQTSSWRVLRRLEPSLEGRARYRFGLRGDAEGWERQCKRKGKKGIAKDRRLEFHIPPTFEDLNPTPKRRIRPGGGAI